MTIKAGHVLQHALEIYRFVIVHIIRIFGNSIFVTITFYWFSSSFLKKIAMMLFDELIESLIKFSI